jgi:hypothetical protein
MNQILKARIQYSCSEWVQKTQETTPTGRLKRATLMEMCWWMLKAWQSILHDMTAKEKL